MSRECDNKSVGVLVFNENDELLLIERARFPFGFAPPAGHIDDHGGSKEAAVKEVSEETGLIIAASSLKQLVSGKNLLKRCRRGGDHHMWDVYETRSYSGQLTVNEEEALSVGWYKPKVVQYLIDQARREGDDSIQGQCALESVWLDLFSEIGTD